MKTTKKLNRIVIAKSWFNEFEYTVLQKIVLQSKNTDYQNSKKLSWNSKLLTQKLASEYGKQTVEAEKYKIINHKKFLAADWIRSLSPDSDQTNRSIGYRHNTEIYSPTSFRLVGKNLSLTVTDSNCNSNLLLKTFNCIRMTGYTCNQFVPGDFQS